MTRPWRRAFVQHYRCLLGHPSESVLFNITVACWDTRRRAFCSTLPLLAGKHPSQGVERGLCHGALAGSSTRLSWCILLGSMGGCLQLGIYINLKWMPIDFTCELLDAPYGCADESYRDGCVA